MKMILSADDNWSIGYKNDLLLKIPDDMKYFREKTLNKTVIMGHMTLLSLPKGLPLRDRNNIVFTRNKSDVIKNVNMVSSLNQLKNKIEVINSDDVYVIGGEQIYKMLLDCCEYILVTKIYHKFKSDKSFVNLDQDPRFTIISRGDRGVFKNIVYEFLTYKNICVKNIV